MAGVVRVRDLQPQSAGWWNLSNLRALLGPDAASARAVGHSFGPDRGDPDYAFLAVDRDGDRQAAVVLNLRASKWALVTHELTARESGAAPRPPQYISSLELEGVRIADRVVLFYVDLHMARSSLFYDLEGGAKLKQLVAGLAPGTWEIWRDGYLDDPQGFVPPQAGILYFEAPAGGYYLKKLY